MISIIIPTLNEASNIDRLLAQLAAETEPHEVIVVDGGSTDHTVALARARGVRVESAAGGRGAQLEQGISAARGKTILMLHADSQFPRGGLSRIQSELLVDLDAVGGNFRLVFDGDTEFSAWITDFCSSIRKRGVYYGDSGIFVRRSVYDRIGGIRPLALMEDFDFVRRLEKSGRTICIHEPALRTSIRRFRGRRRRWIVCGWVWIHLLYYLRLPSTWVAGLYDSARLREGSGAPIMSKSERRARSIK